MRHSQISCVFVYVTGYLPLEGKCASVNGFCLTSIKVQGLLLESRLAHGSLALDARARRHFSKFDVLGNFQKW